MRLRPTMCLECEEQIGLAENEHGQLYLTCSCSKERSTKVGKALPEGWV